MAGPTASIWIDTPVDSATQEFVHSICTLVASEVEGSDFRVKDTRPINGSYNGQGRPFLSTLDDLLPGYIDYIPEDISAVSSHFASEAKAEISFAAMCNQPEDHRILGELCLHTANAFNGIVNFNGGLYFGVYRDRAKRSSVLRSLATKDDYLSTDLSDYGTTDFLRAWLSHPDFRMVK